MSRKDPKPGSILMADHITTVVCKHGHLYIRLHDAKGAIFAVACTDRAVAFMMVDQIMAEFSSPTADCEGLH